MSVRNWIAKALFLQNIALLVTIVFIGFSVLMLYILFSNTHNLTELEQVIVQQAKESHKMAINSELMELARSRTRLTSKIIDTDDVFEQDEINMQLDVYASQFARLRTEYLSLEASEFEQSIISKQNVVIAVILPAQRETVDLAMNHIPDNNSKARQLLYSIVLPGQGNLIDSYAALIVHEQKIIDKLSQSSQQSVNAMHGNSYKLIGISLLLLVTISIIVIIRIKKIQGELLDSHKNLEQTVEKRTRELNQATQVAEQAAIEKTQFLATMSHEIRTPMNGVLGMTRLLETTDLNSTQTEYVKTILNSGKLLLTIINDILDFSKLEANKVEFEKITFNLKTICEEVLQVLKNESDEKNIRLSLNYSDNSPEHYSGDPSRLRQILFNLIGNALKFTEKGSVSLSVHVVDKKNTTAHIRIEIEDTGVGIKKEHQDNLFQSFTQADNSTTRKFGGTGLGLAICKQLVNLMGGDIGVKSEFGKGSVFYFDIKLPIADTIDQENIIKLNTESDQVLSLNGHVLLVEDVLVNQKIAEAMLKNIGITCDIASDGKEALEMWRQNDYKLIFMDCRMPVMDGYQATQVIRSEEGDNKHIPILALTANATEDDQQKCKKFGMDDIILKPFQQSDLTTALSKWL